MSRHYIEEGSPLWDMYVNAKQGGLVIDPMTWFAWSYTYDESMMYDYLTHEKALSNELKNLEII